jgi:hypothetical protein
MCVAVSPAVERRDGDLEQFVRLTPEMIERLRAASLRGQAVLNRVKIARHQSAPIRDEQPAAVRTDPAPPPPPGIVLAPERPGRPAGDRPPGKQKRNKERRRNRNIQRENWEEAD